MSHIKEYRDLFREADALFNQVMESSGINGNKYMTLFCIADGINTQAEISKAFYIPKQTLNSTVQGLSKQGLIKIEDAQHKAKPLSLTDKGKELYATQIEPMKKLEEAAFCMLSDDEQRTMCDIMRKYNSFVKQKINDYLVKND